MLPSLSLRVFAVQRGDGLRPELSEAKAKANRKRQVLFDANKSIRYFERQPARLAGQLCEA